MNYSIQGEGSIETAQFREDILASTVSSLGVKVCSHANVRSVSGMRALSL